MSLPDGLAGRLGEAIGYEVADKRIPSISYALFDRDGMIASAHVPHPGNRHPFGEGTRMPIGATRTLLHAALSGALDGVAYRTDAVFGLEVPIEVPGVDPGLLDPRTTWQDPDAYDRKAAELAGMFRQNFEKFTDAGSALASAGPR